MNESPAISVHNVGKAYRIWESPVSRLSAPILEFTAQLLPAGSSLAKSLKDRAARCYRDFWALKDINFEVKRGESIGIIGRNGSGKSTLLQIIAGTLQPSSGTIKVQGKVAALLELGSGFNTEFTGRENIYIYTSVLGFNRAETDRKYASIVAFSELGEFIDQPVKTYSSGMLMRLAFACIVHVDPDILIVDEALSVGDIRFQRKCKEWIDGLIKKGVTFLFVSHSPAEVTQITQRGILLDHGRLLRSGSSKEVIVDYQRLLFGEEIARPEKTDPVAPDGPESSAVETSRQKSNITLPEAGREHLIAHAQHILNQSEPAGSTHEVRHGNGDTKIIDFGILDASGMRTATLISGETHLLFFHGLTLKPLPKVFAAFAIRNVNGVELFYTNTELQQKSPPALKPGDVFQVTSQVVMCLNDGDYFLSVITRDGESLEATDRRLDAFHFRVITKSKHSGGLVNLEPSLEFNLIGNSLAPGHNPLSALP